MIGRVLAVKIASIGPFGQLDPITPNSITSASRPQRS